MQDTRVIHTFQKNPHEEIRFSLKEYKSRHYFDVRLWYLPSKGGEYRPTHKGITLSVEFLEELRKGLEKASKMVLEEPLQASGKSVEYTHSSERRDVPHGG